MFVDRVKISLAAGRGGNGCLSFRREWSVPRGGPDGGRGGDGGNIWLVSDASVKSLSSFRFHPINKAKNGGHGEGSNRYGHRGADLTLSVPLGTVVKDAMEESVLFDFIDPDIRNLDIAYRIGLLKKFHHLELGRQAPLP